MASDLIVQNLRGPGSGANANKIIIPSGHKVVAEAGGLVAPGQVIQVVQRRSTTQESTTSTSPQASSIYVTITPKYSNSNILIVSSFQAQIAGAGLTAYYTLYRESTNLAASQFIRLETASSTFFGSQSIDYLDTPSTTNQITYRIYYWAQTSSATNQIGLSGSPGVITAMEIAQ
jgi:hypothetical protein